MTCGQGRTLNVLMWASLHHHHQPGLHLHKRVQQARVHADTHAGTLVCMPHTCVRLRCTRGSRPSMPMWDLHSKPRKYQHAAIPWQPCAAVHTCALEHCRAHCHQWFGSPIHTIFIQHLVRAHRCSVLHPACRMLISAVSTQLACRLHGPFACACAWHRPVIVAGPRPSGSVENLELTAGSCA